MYCACSYFLAIHKHRTCSSYLSLFGTRMTIIKMYISHICISRFNNTRFKPKAKFQLFHTFSQKYPQFFFFYEKVMAKSELLFLFFPFSLSTFYLNGFFHRCDAVKRAGDVHEVVYRIENALFQAQGGDGHRIVNDHRHIAGIQQNSYTIEGNKRER